MSELIDRQALIKQLKDENIPFNADINEIINIQPIAFDVANIVDKLEEEKKKDEQRAIKTDETENISLITALQAMADRYKEAINIVKQEINKEN